MMDAASPIRCLPCSFGVSSRSLTRNSMRFSPGLSVTALLSVVACGGQSAPPAKPAADRATNVTSRLIRAVQVEGQAPERWSLAERMAKYRVPGVSIAVADSGRIVWAKGFGLKQVGTTDSVD